jgi:hypothetical protein
MTDLIDYARELPWRKLDSERVEDAGCVRVCALVTHMTHRTARYGCVWLFPGGTPWSRDGRETAVAADGVRS